MTSLRKERPSLLLKLLLVVLLVLVVVGAGFSLLLKPQMTKLRNSSQTLTEKQAQLHEMQVRESQRASVETKVQAAYENAKTSVVPFFSDELSEAELEMYLAKFLNENNITRSSVTVSAPIVVELTAGEAGYEKLDYELGAFATAAVADEKSAESAEEMLRIPMVTITVEYHQTAQEDVERFLDAIAGEAKHLVVQGSSIKTDEDGSVFGALELGFYLAAQPKLSTE